MQAGVRFSAVVSSELAQWYKPAPDAYEALLERLRVDPYRVWYVGDHLHVDINGSKEAGMTAVWVNRPGGASYYAGQVGLEPGRTHAPDAEVQDLRELATLLDAAEARPAEAKG